ncbi:MAG: thioredoxin domain-containing protein, partial [Anaerolineae bacterium]
ETSPYLLQHAHNPVDWYPWGEEALRRAKEEDKPIFLSIGYSACHWCHVMERESFQDPATAELMNRLFINIKVDREERPDLDALYMEVVQLLTGQGGWPMSVFLTPDRRPFYAGTYFPPRPDQGMPSFRQVLQAVADAYRDDPEGISENATQIVDELRSQLTLPSSHRQPQAATLHRAEEALARQFDSDHGGFGEAPKFPHPSALEFLLQRQARTEDSDLLEMVTFTLERMARGGIYDQLGGGFHRYSTDAVWLVPHFEKMLYDNAQLLRLYLHAWQITSRPLFLRVVDQTLEYVEREMTSPEGLFYSSQDADTEGQEGRFYLWTPAQLEEALGTDLARVMRAYFGMEEGDDPHAPRVLSLAHTDEEVGKELGIPAQQAAEAFSEGRQRLFDARRRRQHPGRDDKAITEWNGLMIHALAECGAALNRPELLARAERAAGFILDHMSRPDGGLHRIWVKGEARGLAFQEDYAALIRALVALYEAGFERRWLEEARRLADLMIDRFADPQGGFFQTGPEHEDLVARRKEFTDSGTPSGNALAAEALLRLSLLDQNQGYLEQVKRLLSLTGDAMRQAPLFLGQTLGVLDLYLSPSRQVVVVGEPGRAETKALLRAIQSRYLPHTVVALRRPGEEAYLSLLEGKEPIDSRAAAFICEDYTCLRPVTSPEQLSAQLSARP